MSHTKKFWIISQANQFVVEKNGKVFQYQLVMRERNGFTSAKAAKAELYHAKRALHDDRLQVVGF